MGINYYKGRVCLNVLGGSLKNAAEIYEAAEKYVVVGCRECVCGFRA